jgi:hypothetical protein
VLLCFDTHAEHPSMPGQPWYKLNDVLTSGHTHRKCPVFTLEQHAAAALKLEACHRAMRRRRA